MKAFLIAIFAISIGFVACKNNSSSSDEKNMTSHDSMAKEDQTATSTAASNLPVIKASFPNADTAITSNVKEIVSHYIHVKNALINSDASEAKMGATMLIESIQKADKSLFPADQKKEY